MKATHENLTRTQFRRHGFSMIEVILGLGLIAFGLISIAALFPVGLRANQAAIGETYAAQHAEQFLHTVKTVMTSADDSQANWAKYAEVLPTSKPGSSEPEGWDTFLKQDAVVYRVSGDNKQFYRIEQSGMVLGSEDIEDLTEGMSAEVAEKTKGQLAEATDSGQFSAVCRVWRTPVVITRYDEGVWRDTTYDVDEAIDLNVEISWPADKPYAARQKALYQLEIFRPEL